MLEEMVARQPPSAGSRPVAIGSRSIAVSLQPAIPRRVAPQQSPLPLHRSPTIVAQSRSGEAVKCAAQPHCKDAVQRFAVTALSRRAHPPPMGCHFYFARRLTFLSCADNGQMRRIAPAVWGVWHHAITTIAFYTRGHSTRQRVRDCDLKELAMPDLDQIKQGEQGARDRRGRFARGRSGNPAGRAAAATASTALPGYCSPARAAADPQCRRFGGAKG
jgi:hypothetical protein